MVAPYEHPPSPTTNTLVTTSKRNVLDCPIEAPCTLVPLLCRRWRTTVERASATTRTATPIPPDTKKAGRLARPYRWSPAPVRLSWQVRIRDVPSLPHDRFCVVLCIHPSRTCGYGNTDTLVRRTDTPTSAPKPRYLTQRNHATIEQIKQSIAKTTAYRRAARDAARPLLKIGNGERRNSDLQPLVGRASVRNPDTRPWRVLKNQINQPVT